MEYKEYIQSWEWKLRADETKRLANYRCQVCNSDENLNAHHRTYERLGNELQIDLICLCRKCHDLFHNGGTVIENKVNTEALLCLASFVSDWSSGYGSERSRLLYEWDKIVKVIIQKGMSEQEFDDFQRSCDETRKAKNNPAFPNQG